MEEMPADILGLLGPNERVELYIQQKFYFPTTNVDSVLFTNERIILRHPRNLGLKTDFSDLSYDDVAKVSIEQGVLRSTVTCFLKSKEEPLCLRDLLNADAQSAYGIVRRYTVQHEAFSHSSPTMDSGTVSLLQHQGSAPSELLQTHMVREIVREVFLVSCSHCGTRSPQGTIKCPTCGATL